MHRKRRIVVSWLVAIAAVLAGGGQVGMASLQRPLLAQQTATNVDVLLVLAVDVSFSIDLDELKLQREGYAAALTSPEFLTALKEGANGRIAIAYFEWAASDDQRIVVPWRVVDGPESAARVAKEITDAALRRAARTSISGAINFGRNLIREAGMNGVRRVIDVSGDGPNNNGETVTIARDNAVNEGITINGLPVMIKPAMGFGFDIERLDDYYEDCVIGGPGAFVVPVEGRDKFISAIRKKLVQEVAGIESQPRLRRVSADEPRISCAVGETLWRDRWERYNVPR